MRLIIVILLAVLAIVGSDAMTTDTHYCHQDYQMVATKFFPCNFDNYLMRQLTRDPSKNIVFKCRNIPANTPITYTYTIQYANANTNLPYSVSAWILDTIVNGSNEPNDQVDGDILSAYSNWTVTTPPRSSSSCFNGADCLTSDTSAPRSYTLTTTSPTTISTIETFVHDETLTAIPDASDLVAQYAYCQSFFVSLSIS
jgi:hypothetical protein